VTERKETEAVQRALYSLSEAVHEAEDLPALYRSIHEILADLMPADNVYLALYDKESETLRFAYFVDQHDPPPAAPIPVGRGLTEHVLRTQAPLLADAEGLLALEREGGIALRGALPASWLGVPLHSRREVIGVLACQSYDPDVRFEPRHERVLSFVAEQIATAVERKRHEEEIARMAYHDGLTGLGNRRMLQERAPQFLAMARRKEWPVSLLYLDLDRFKNINDTLGHDAGDEVLIEIASVLEGCLRDSDLLARLGGDEFAFLLADVAPPDAELLASRVTAALDRPFVAHGEKVYVGCSIGITTFPHHGFTLEELLKHADIAMYRAKQEGVEFSTYDSERSPYSRERLALERDLRRAVAEGSDELTVHYQPTVLLASGARTGVEALVRWRRGDILVAASEFIPTAEESGLVREVDRVVLEHALREASAGLPGSMELAVNLSTQSLHSEGLVARVARLLEDTGFDPRRLLFEVTESAALRNPETSYRTLEEIRALGVRLAMDDFGSGFASLTYLRRMPLDRVKLDRSLVLGIGVDARMEQLIRGSILLSHSMGLEVLAEGLERDEQLEWLRAERCDLVQGYLVGRPTPLEEAVESGESA
jgi:diguanylate cyclase (GGDEF)-like protein